MKRFLLTLSALVLGLTRLAAADLVPSSRLVDWTPGTETGIIGGIPTGRSVVNITGLDATGATDVTAGLNAWLAGATAGTNNRLPAGTFRIDGTVSTAAKKNITLSGTLDGNGNYLTTLEGRSGYPLVVGQTTGVGIPSGYDATDVTVTTGTFAKGDTTLSIGDTGFMTAGDLVMLQVWENDPNLPVFSPGGSNALVNQMLKVVSVDSGTAFTFSPALYDDYGGGALEVRILHAKYAGATPGYGEGIGIEDLLIELENVSGSQSNGVTLSQVRDSWVKNVRVNNAFNYPFAVANGLNLELRKNYAAPRRVGGSNGAGVLFNYTSASLVVDNIIIDNNPLWEVNSGSNGNLFTRNYGSGSYFNINHGPWNQYNLYQFNVGQGFLSDGYFGGDSRQHVISNLLDFLTLKRGSYETTLAVNLLTQNPVNVQLGYPNISNDSYSGTANFPTTPWADYGMTGQLTSITKGTGTGYLVNNPSGYVAGDTIIALDSGSGTILDGDVVTFTGDSNRYYVGTGLSGGTITITKAQDGSVGLKQSLANNVAVTVTSDRALITLTSPYTLPVYVSGDRPQRTLLWDNYNTIQSVLDNTQSAGVLGTLSYNNTIQQPNTIALPSIGTTFVIGTGNTGFQELDQKVEATIIRAGNRYGNGDYEGLGGATLNSVFVESVKPDWVLAYETEFSTTFAINPYNASLYTSGSPSDIPAGYRALFLTPPQQQTASINSAGTQLTLTVNKNMAIGSGGSGGFSVGGDIVLTYASISGSNIIFNTSRVVNQGETFTLSYTQPGNGAEDTNGNDLPSFSNIAVSNFSQQGSGVTWVMAVNAEDAPIEVGLTEGGATRQPIIIPTGGFATGIRIAIADLVATQLSKVALLDTNGTTVLETTSKIVETPDDYTVYDINSTRLEAGTYTVALATNGSNSLFVRYTNAGPESSSFGFISNYASWPGASVPNDGSQSRTYSFGIRMIFDTGSAATVTGTTTVTGTLTLP
jgi:hypothetical protein